MPSLTEIIKDLEDCKEYDHNHTMETAFRYMENLRSNMLDLALHVKNNQLRTEVRLDRIDPAGRKPE